MELVNLIAPLLFFYCLVWGAVGVLFVFPTGPERKAWGDARVLGCWLLVPLVVAVECAVFLLLITYEVDVVRPGESAKEAVERLSPTFKLLRSIQND